MKDFRKCLLPGYLRLVRRVFVTLLRHLHRNNACDIGQAKMVLELQVDASRLVQGKNEAVNRKDRLARTIVKVQAARRPMDASFIVLAGFREKAFVSAPFRLFNIFLGSFFPAVTMIMLQPPNNVLEDEVLEHSDRHDVLEPENNVLHRYLLQVDFVLEPVYVHQGFWHWRRLYRTARDTDTGRQTRKIGLDVRISEPGKTRNIIDWYLEALALLMDENPAGTGLNQVLLGVAGFWHEISELHLSLLNLFEACLSYAKGVHDERGS